MNVKIEIACDNAAFQDEPTIEIARILRELADRVERRDQPESPIGLRDINGNTVGEMVVRYPKARNKK